MSLRNLVIFGALTVLAPRAAAAQAAQLRPAASELFRPMPGAGSDTLNLRQTYWKEGALIVGIPSAIAGGALGVGLCGLSDSADRNCALTAIGFGALMGAVGAITGALIGGQFEKSP